MNQAIKIGPTIKGVSIYLLPVSAVAARYFQDGEGLESNPYELGSEQREQFQWAMHKLQAEEFKRDMGSRNEI